MLERPRIHGIAVSTGVLLLIALLFSFNKTKVCVAERDAAIAGMRYERTVNQHRPCLVATTVYYVDNRCEAATFENMVPTKVK